KTKLTVVLWLVLLISVNEVRCEAFSRIREPWKTLIEEGLRFPSFLKTKFLTPEEQESLQLAPNEEALVVKLILKEQNFTGDMRSRASKAYKSLQLELKHGLKSVLGEEFPESDVFKGKWKLQDIQSLGHLTRVLLSLNGSDASDNEKARKNILRAISQGQFGHLPIWNGTAEVYQQLVEKNTVFDVTVQLYDQPFVAGMDLRESQTFLNMSDQMHQMLGTRFKNVFGEHFFRMTIVGFYPSLQSTVIRAYVLLDPDPENIYYASIAWYDIKGYVYLGKFPLLPQNIKIAESRLVLKEFYHFLNGLAVLLVVFFGIFRACHYVAYERNQKKEPIPE
ncbi:hypothetical protein TCAL_10746, partial [Tigriopus californicus]